MYPKISVSDLFYFDVRTYQFCSANLLLCYPCRYCVPGTIGHKLMSDKHDKVDLDPNTKIDVRCQVHISTFNSVFL